MLRLFVRTLLTLLIVAWLFPAISIANGTTIVVVTLVFILTFKLVKPILSLIFLPINVITLGLFSSLLNVFLLWAITVLVPGFTITGATVLGYELSPLVTYIFVSVLIGFIQPMVGFFI